MNQNKGEGAKLLKILIIGLLFPACVIAGLFGGWILGRNWGLIGEFILALAGGIGGMILGLVLILKLLLKEEK